MEHNDLLALLLDGKDTPHGQYDHANWSTCTEGEGTSNEAMVASVHESMHHVLNNTTLFGLTLIVVAQLAREKPEFSGDLSKLVDQCRRSHEIFATYTSLILVDPDLANPQWVDERYASAYGNYVREARMMMQGIAWPHIQHIVLNALMRVCFQSADITDAIGKGQPHRPDEETSPDFRMRTLQSRLTDTYWAEAQQRFLQALPDTSDCHMLFQKHGDRIIEDKWDTARLNEFSLEYGEFLYEYLSTSLLEADLKTLSSNDHLKHLPALLAFAEQHLGEIDLKTPLKQDQDPEQDFGLSEFENEVLVQRKRPHEAVLEQFSDIPIKDWATLEFRARKINYIYVVSRISERFTKQFSLSEQDRTQLLQQHPDFIVAIIVKTKKDDLPLFRIILLDQPGQLKALSNKKHLILSNSSMLLLADKRWSEWHSHLEEFSTHTTLLDLSPSLQIPRIRQQYDVMEFAKFNLEAGDNTYLFITLICRGSLPTGVYHIPCTLVFANILYNFLEQQTFTREYAYEDDANEGINLVLRLGMSHLIDEHHFDFHALNSDYTLRGFKQGVFETHP